MTEYEIYTVGPESVGLTELEYDTLRALNEGNGLEAFPEHWRDAIPCLISAELLADEHHPPSLNSAQGPRGTQTVSGVGRTAEDRPGYYLTNQGYTVLAQVGSFRRPIPVPVRWRPSWRQIGWAAFLAAVTVATAVALFSQGIG